jgi:hypothetical protein
MAKIPRKKGKSTKGTPPKDTVTSENLHKPSGDKKVALNFLVDSEFRKSLKAYALENDMSMVKLLQKMFDFYKENH